MATLNVRMDQTLYAAIKAAAARESRTVASYVRHYMTQAVFLTAGQRGIAEKEEKGEKR